MLVQINLVKFLLLLSNRQITNGKTLNSSAMARDQGSILESKEKKTKYMKSIAQIQEEISLKPSNYFHSA